MNVPDDIKHPVLIRLRRGMYLLLDRSIYRSMFNQVEKNDQQSSPSLSEEEMDVLKKINRIRFEQRTPDVIQRVLTEKERKIFDRLVRKRYVSVYRKGKYSKDGVVAISDAVYPLLRESLGQSRGSEKEGSLVDQLHKSGYLILTNEHDAQTVSRLLEKDIRAGKVIGVRGFDKKYYVMTKELFSTIAPKIVSFIETKGSATIGDLARSLSLEEGMCRTAVNLLIENGTLVEKEKDRFEVL